MQGSVHIGQGIDVPIGGGYVLAHAVHLFKGCLVAHRDGIQILFQRQYQSLCAEHGLGGLVVPVGVAHAGEDDIGHIAAGEHGADFIADIIRGCRDVPVQLDASHLLHQWGLIVVGPAVFAVSGAEDTQGDGAVLYNGKCSGLVKGAVIRRRAGWYC